VVLIQDAEVDGRVVDVLLDGGRIAAIAPDLDGPAGGAVIAGRGGSLLPGLHDHHVHLLALAARASSISLGPPAVTAPHDLDAAIRSAHRARPQGEWLRGVDHDDDLGGPLDRSRLDDLAPGRPLRVQHRSGAYWVLSTAALAHLPVDRSLEGVERDPDGAPTGRLWRLDGWLRRHLPDAGPPDLAEVGRRFSRRGVTGVTDATPSVDASDFDVLAEAVRSGALPLRVTVMGSALLSATDVPEPLRRGPVKIVIGDHDLPGLDAVAHDIETAHRSDRAVAIHCVTAVAAALSLAAWEVAGVRRGDRMEHGSVLDPAAADRLAALGITVVTQPAFVHDHGDRYLDEVDPTDRPHLYRCATLLEHGVAVAGSSDTPFGDADPWQAIATAVDRRTAAGRALGAGEAVSPARALALYLGTPEAPGGPPRVVRVGEPADLCLLTRPLSEVLADPAAVEVRATFAAARPTHLLDD
jgi:predicted amidohydrolase YtcJ